MVTTTELNRLLSLVEWNARLSFVDGLTPLRILLSKDDGGDVLRFLTRALPKLIGKKQGGIAFVIAEHYRLNGELKKLQKLYVTDEAEVKESVLDALQGEPGSNLLMGPGIVQLAIDGMHHRSPAVRTVACSVIQNQCDWRVDVHDAIARLQELLSDDISRVRHQASYAIGNLAKRKYNMAASIPQLRRNVKHEGMYVREASAWALWQLSRNKHDISAAVPELVWLLTDPEEYNEQRKKAAGALLHHAKKSVDNARAVKDCARTAALNLEHKEVQKFVRELKKLK